MKLALIALIFYILLNVFDSKRINKSYYLSEEMRSLRKKLIWFLPLLDPILINKNWRKPLTNNIKIKKIQRI